MALATGLRIGELAGLTWDDVDFEEDTLYVNRTLLYQKDYHTGEYSFRYQTPKSESSRRVVPLIPEVLEVLEMQRHQQQTLREERGSLWQPLKGMSSLVFTTRNGTPVQEVYLIKTLEKVTLQMQKIEREEAGKEGRRPYEIKRITPHTLRHTFATRVFENGLAPKTVQEILGHSSLSITMDLYTHVTSDQKRNEMNKINHVLHIL